MRKDRLSQNEDKKGIFERGPKIWFLKNFREFLMIVTKKPSVSFFLEETIQAFITEMK